MEQARVPLPGPQRLLRVKSFHGMVGECQLTSLLTASGRRNTIIDIMEQEVRYVTAFDHRYHTNVQPGLNC
jgi:hypothetical protein